MKFIKNIENLISKGHLKKALELMASFCEENSAIFLDDVIFESSKLNIIDKNLSQQVIDYEQAFILKAKLALAIISIKNRIKEEFFFISENDFRTYLDKLLREHQTLHTNFIPIKIKSDEDIKDGSYHFIQSQNNRRLLVLGDAGIGKSSLVQELCYNLAKDYSSAENEIPVLIKLRHFREEISIIDSIVQEIEKGRDIVYKLLQNGKIVILLDGLDEVAHYIYSLVCDQIRNIISEFPHISIIITSRPNVHNLRYEFTRLKIVEIVTDILQQERIARNDNVGKLAILENIKAKNIKKEVDLKLVLGFVAFEIKLSRKTNASFGYYDALIISSKFKKIFGSSIDVIKYLEEGRQVGLISFDDQTITFSHTMHHEYLAALYLQQIPDDLKRKEFKRYGKHLKTLKVTPSDFWDICLKLDNVSFIKNLCLPQLTKIVSKIDQENSIYKKFRQYIKLARVDLICSQENGEVKLIGVSNYALIDLFKYIGKYIRDSIEIKDSFFISSGFISELFQIHLNASYRPEIVIDYVDRYYLENINSISSKQFYVPLYELIDSDLSKKIKKSNRFVEAQNDFLSEVAYYRKTISMIGSQ